MAFEQIGHEKLQKTISLLDQALYNHQQWFNALIRTLICKLPPDQHDMSPMAHQQCRFGQWYCSSETEDLKEHPGFKALGEAHSRMHGLARSLLSTIDAGTLISPLDYDNFSNALDGLRLETATLKRELENLLYNRDILTGAINRVNMLTFLREKQESSKRDHQPCHIAMMDLDHFKNVNDTYGHPAGDSVLKAATQSIIQTLRPTDAIFRYGGEEFVIYLHHMDLNAAFQFVEKLRKGLSEIEFSIAPQFHITASFGVAQLDTYIAVEQSIERADKATLAAKAKGGNCTLAWKPGM